MNFESQSRFSALSKSLPHERKNTAIGLVLNTRAICILLTEEAYIELWKVLQEKNKDKQNMIRLNTWVIW